MINFKMNKNNRENLISKLRELDPTKLWEVIIRKPKSIRSLDQNELYWEMITQMSFYFGYEKQEMHSLMVYKFLTEFKEVINDTVPVIKSTTQLNTAEFNDYIEKIKQWACDYGFNFEEK